MISSYRLGDLVILNNFTIDDTIDLLREHSNTFGSKFIVGKINNFSIDSIDLITKIVLEFLDKNSEFLPL